MSNARHLGLPPHLAEQLHTRTGMMLLYKPTELSYEQALHSLIDQHPACDVVGAVKHVPSAHTPHSYGKALMDAHYAVRVTADDSDRLVRLREEARRGGFPFRPEELLQLWNESSLLSRTLCRERGLSDEVVFAVEQVFEALNRDIEQTFTQSGNVNLTGLLHLPPVLGLRGSGTVIGVQPQGQPLTPRARLLLSRAAPTRLILLSDHPEMQAWTLRFPVSAAS